MADVKSSPKQSKRKILDFLQSRKGVLRTGAHPARQILHCILFKQGRGSAHQAITAVQVCLDELAAAGEIILRKDSGGVQNYVALPTADDPTAATGGELTVTERDDFYIYLSTQYSIMQTQLAKAEEDAATSLELANEYDQIAKNANAAKDEALKKLAEAEAKLANCESATDFDGIRRFVVDTEAKLAGIQTERDEALATIQAKADENARLSTKLQQAESQNASKDEANKALQGKVNELSGTLKQQRKDHADEVVALKHQIDAFEKGDGLNAAKALAIAADAMDAALDQVWDTAMDTTFDICNKHLPPEKQAALRRDMDAWRKKFARRRS